LRPRILFVEDDPAVRETATLLLESAGLDVVAEANGQRGLERFTSAGADLVILDVMLPAVGGFDLCREIRSRSSVPVLMLTARTATADVVAGLEVGADDYVTKPYEPSELIARVRALLRRVGGPDDEVVAVRDLRIDPAAFRVEKGGEEVALSATEFRLLHELAAHPGQVFTREVLLERMWHYDYLGDSRLVDMAVKRLRDKVEDDPHAPAAIKTVRGVGYRFDA
jgi:two-component system, OmpR family, response regulator MtrA